MILANATSSGARGYAQRITTPGHELAADEPENRGGTNTGPSPFELMLSSLGACTAITFACTPSGSSGTDEPLRIERKISVTETLEPDRQAKLLEIADKTPVTRALAPGVAIQTIFE